MSYIKIWIHAVWGTKKRESVLKPDILKQLCMHIRSNAEDKGIYIDRINGFDDHVHILMLLKSDNSISKQIQLLKGESAFWLNRTGLLKTKLEWADKYFAASVSNDKIDNVRTYIDNQQEHHKKQIFAEEYKHFIESLGYAEVDFG
jgi:putative transposase